MKVLYYFLIPVLIFTGCKKHTINEITVTGHLDGTDMKEISLISDVLTFKAPIDSTGTFNIKFISNQPRIYQLLLKNSLNLFLIPGDKVIINSEGNDYKFSGGQSAVLSNYYSEWEKYWNRLTANFDEEKYYSREPDDFTKTVYSYIDTSKILLNELSKKQTNINPEFMRLENERLKYWMISDFLPYEYERYKQYRGKEPAVNESFHNYMKVVDLNDSSLLQLDAYKDFLISYINYLSGKKLQSNTDASRNRYTGTNFILNFILSEIKNQKVLDYVIFKEIYNRTNELKVDDKNLTVFKEHCRNKSYIRDVETRYKELEVLMPGKQAPDFTLYDSNNKEFKLSDFKGKYLLIDVWGAFCQPCKKDVPYLKQIEHDYKGKNIGFIGVCFEKNREIWLKRIKEFNLEGTQLTVKDSWDSQFRRDYQIPWVPTYILIDKEGKIIDSRAPRPSENLSEILKTFNI